MRAEQENTGSIKKELKSLRFSVWKKGSSTEHSQFFGNALDTSKYLALHDLAELEVSAIDLNIMHSMKPMPARKWLNWYFKIALAILEEQNFSEHVTVPYPTSTVA
ncbi:MAG: hypothetical protein R3281_15775 [Balneolaceae bacterium]|nr:hypothetical protein [Balneolaceae bacterium]